MAGIYLDYVSRIHGIIILSMVKFLCLNDAMNVGRVDMIFCGNDGRTPSEVIGYG